MRPMRLCLLLASDASSPARARTSVRAFSLGLPSELVRDLQLVVSELIAHTIAGRPSSVRIELESAGADAVRGRIVPVDPGTAAPPPMDPLGRRVVDALTSAWGTEPDGGATWFALGGRG